MFKLLPLFFHQIVLFVIICFILSRTWAVEISEDQEVTFKSVTENNLQVDENNPGVDEIYNISSQPENNQKLPVELKSYEGNFTDSDGDGMTDVAEIKYGYNPQDPASFPPVDFIASLPTEYPIQNSTFNNASIIENESGFIIKWDNNQSSTNYNRYSLTLKDGSRELYYGGHGWSEAKVPYAEFELDGSEVLSGRFTEYNPENGNFVKDFEWFEINLADHPLPPADNEIAADNDKISFRFNNFSTQEKDRYIHFMRRVLPILKDILGNPAETFVCDFNKDNNSFNSWVTLDQGRSISLDDAWIPRLLVHEMIHMWKGKYAFSYTAENWGYADDLNGFEEIAEGIAYEILHDYVEAYPFDENTLMILENGAWWNWAPGSSNFDTIKHQKHTGAGTFWSGESIFHQDRYSISAMVIQNIMRHDPEFMKSMLREYYDNIESDSSYRPTRSGLIDLWSSHIPKINGIDTKSYLEAIPVFNGQKLEQKYYPVIFQHESYSYGTTKAVFGSYAVDGYFWWQTVTSSNLSNFNIPSWVKYNLDADGYYYIDSNNLPFEIVTQNIFEETISEYSSILDTGYQNPEKTVPNNLFTDRIESLDSSDLPQGLYLEKLTFSTLSEHTEDASETFYTFGYDGFEQGENDYSLFVGIDSKFAENITVSVKGKSYDLPLVNGCAILQTSALAPNAEGAILITVNSFEKSNSYQRSLVNAGSYDGRRHQQLLIIDRDFDGIEDLYDSDVDSSSIEVAYQNYKNAYPNHRKSDNFFTVEVEGTTGGTIETIDFASGDALKSGSVLTIRAKPNESFVFNGWSGDLVSTSIEANITIVKDMVITGSFTEAKNYFSLNILTTEGGEIKEIEDLNGKKVEGGTTLRFTAQPDQGYEFTGWTSSLGQFPSSQNPLSITVHDDTTLQANFSQPQKLPVISIVQEGINLTWKQTVDSKFNLTLNDQDRLLFSGGHAEGSALVDYDAFGLDGTETLRGRFTEYDENGEFVSDFAWFEIRLTEYKYQNLTSSKSEIGNGWHELTWFGAYLPFPSGWYFHSELGWMYLGSDNTESIWFWNTDFGWCWTNQDIYPHIYRFQYSSWLFFDRNRRQFYDYWLDSWVVP